ncbi:hypothetical protein TMatcc_004393 [Talaromyces marneffei ATCC 18224]|uniref:uncharacterized protein n=1 Tax=Talaromyces marneffei TaxID=37727 RepID=UPI0012A89A16|nr:uncharacterized protein EYB26_000656 [Talaromyces marneffei]QGA13011.1 hypothetical protein EYB26_000656 [Talaromyces marneffei]
MRKNAGIRRRSKLPSSHQVVTFHLPDQTLLARQITLTGVVINTGKIFSNSLNSRHHPFNGSRRSSARGGASGSIYSH